MTEYILKVETPIDVTSTGSLQELTTFTFPIPADTNDTFMSVDMQFGTGTEDPDQSWHLELNWNSDAPSSPGHKLKGGRRGSSNSGTDWGAPIRAFWIERIVKDSPVLHFKMKKFKGDVLRIRYIIFRLRTWGA